MALLDFGSGGDLGALFCGTGARVGVWPTPAPRRETRRLGAACRRTVFRGLASRNMNRRLMTDDHRGAEAKTATLAPR